MLHERILKNQSHVLIMFGTYRRVALGACREGKQEFLTITCSVLSDMFSADYIQITSTNYRRMHQRAIRLARVRILLPLKSLVSLLQHVVASFHRIMNGVMIGW